jgi:hypothetical protein
MTNSELLQILKSQQVIRASKVANGKQYQYTFRYNTCNIVCECIKNKDYFTIPEYEFDEVFGDTDWAPHEQI